MKLINLKICITSCLVVAMATSCEKLSLQKDYEHNPHPLNPETGKNSG